MAHLLNAKRVFILSFILLILVASGALYHWLRPMTPGEVAAAYEWGRRSEKLEKRLEVAELLVESARETFSECARLDAKRSFSRGRFSLWNWLRGVPRIPRVELESAKIDGDTAEIWYSFRSANLLFIPRGLRLAVVDGKWLITHAAYANKSENQRVGITGTITPQRWIDIETFYREIRLGHEDYSDASVPVASEPSDPEPPANEGR